MKIAISQKGVNIFVPNFSHLFGTKQCTNVLPCAVFSWHTVHQIDGNATFKNEFHNWTKSWFNYCI